MSEVKLFCFPYAGGSAILYKKWQSYVHPNVKIIPIELAGRGRRMQDPLYEDISDLIEDVFQIVKQQIDGKYAIFGHSLGAVITYELAQKLNIAGVRDPEHLFFSGRGAPHVKDEKERNYHLLNDEDFKNKVLELGGTPPEFFEHPELLELFVPLLRNDFKIAAVNFEDRPITPFEVDITVLTGKDEDLTAGQVYGWRKHTKGLSAMYAFNGEHFFIHDEVEEICKVIDSKLVR